MPKWTVEQQAAIDRRDCDLLVSAAAGSGKTAVLSERVLKRVTGEKPVRVDKLLIVTFTEAAAAEMRQRIVEKLREELMRNPDNDYISRQLALVPKANITTIHSFCLNIIKSNFHLLDMDPGFGIVDEAEKQLMCLEAAVETVNEMYETEGERFSDVAVWLSGGKDAELAELIIKTFNYIQSFENPLEWLMEQIEKYNVESDNIDDLLWTDLLKTKYKVEFSGMLEGYKTVMNLSQQAGSNKHYDIYRSEQSAIERILAACSGKWKDIYDATQSCKFERVNADKEADQELIKYAKDLRDGYKKICQEHIKTIKTITENNAVQSLKKAYPLLVVFGKAIVLFSEKFSAKKREKNYIDFNDFEHLALKLLRDENLPVAATLREKYEEIYVDEYQDCNEVQEAIFYTIARKSEGKCCNMFMVGDVKQSIYKFRQADPGIFMGKLESYKDVGIQSKIMLNKNFRSREQVVDCVNGVFSKIMSKHVGEIEYGADEALYAAFKYPEKDGIEYGGKPEILIVSDETADDEDEELSRVGLEAKAVACKIRSMVGKFHVYDAKAEKYRPSTYRDFAILMRSPGAHTTEIEEQLKKVGIPCFSDKGAGLFDVHETELIISALEITDNPLQDIPLIGFMRSAPGGFDENELLEIRQYANKGYFYNALRKCAAGEGKLSEKCAAFVKMLRTWRKFAKTESVYGLLFKIMDDINFLPYVETLSGGKSRLANVELLCEYARRYEKSDLKGVFNFLKYVEKLEKGKTSDTAKILSEACDVVKIMSIHKSKGLEFPVVFIMKGAGQFNTRDWTSSYMLHKKFGIGCDFVDMEKRIKYPLISKSAISYRLMLEGLSEEMRVLYVALTRAREKLFVTVSGKNPQEKIDEFLSSYGQKEINYYTVQKARSYFDWLILSLNPDKDKCCWEISKFTARQVEQLAEKTEEQYEKSFDKKVEERLKEEISRRLFFQYPYKKSTTLASKYSVTELKTRFNQENDGGIPVYYRSAEPLPSFMSESKMSAAEKGTVLHLILRFVDFYNPDTKAAVEECKAYLLKNSFVTEKQLAAVSEQAVEVFLQSHICEEIRKAESYHRELSFNMCVGGDVPGGDAELKEDTVLLQGIIDCLYIKDDRFYIVDYKTDNGKNTKEELAELYMPQLKLYVYAAEKITGKSFGGAYLYLLSRGELHQVNF